MQRRVDEYTIQDLGQMPYAAALTLQRERHAALVAARTQAPPHLLLLLEHDPPVVTVTRRVGARANVLATDAALARAGVQLEETDRGGDVTYHGPGQLVAYPIVDLQRLGLSVHRYIRALEEAVIRTCARWGVACHREQGATGVWVGAPGTTARKIAAIGVRVSRSATLHGLALNVHPRMDHFDLIVPCGLHGRALTSLQLEVGSDSPPPTMAQVKNALAESLVRALGEASESAAQERVTRP